MAVTKREDRKFKFETLQLHVGQEQQDPMYLKIVHMLQHVLN